MAASWSHRVKLDRAQAHLDALKRATQALIEDQPYPVVLDYDANTGENIMRLGPIPEPTPEIPAIVGDVLFNLRCALDHIVWALSKRPGGCKEDQIGFPVVTHPNGWQAAIRNKIGDVPPAAQAVIECLQPYKSGKPKMEPLFLLHELNRLDKHRTLHTVESFPHRAEAVWDATGKTGVVKVTTAPVPPDGFKQGAEIGRYLLTEGRRATEVYVQFVLARDILFSGGAADKASVHWLLRRMSETAIVALDRLETFL